MHYGNLTLLLNFTSTWAMVGLIWLIQIVHYPLFSRVGEDGFPSYANEHQRLITYIVLPLMFLELGTSMGLWFVRPMVIAPWMAAVGIGLVAVIWLSTFFIQVPQHGQLSLGFDALVHQRLVQGNWIRTVAWSVRGLLTAWMVYAAIR